MRKICLLMLVSLLSFNLSNCNTVIYDMADKCLVLEDKYDKSESTLKDLRTMSLEDSFKSYQKRRCLYCNPLDSIRSGIF